MAERRRRLIAGLNVVMPQLMAQAARNLFTGKEVLEDTITRALGIETPDVEALTYDEDCLFLNVFSPDINSEANLPVLFWVHGGAHRFGSSTNYPGQELAAKGVVVVTINYRLGPLGFLSHPETQRGRLPRQSGLAGYGVCTAVGSAEYLTVWW